MTEGSEELKPARHTLSCVPSRDSDSLVQSPFSVLFSNSSVIMKETL